MKLICSKANLVKSVSIVMKAVPSKTTMPILECILIDASAGEIKFTSNDMELGIETRVEGEIVEKGIVALDAKIFSEIVGKLPDNDITISTDESLNTTITCEKAKFTNPADWRRFLLFTLYKRNTPGNYFSILIKRINSSDNFFNCTQRKQQINDR